MEEYEIDSVVDEFLDNLRDVVYLKVVKKCHVHWWDGWKSEEDSHEGEEDSSEEEENGKLIPFPSIDAAMTYTLNKKRWPRGMSFRLIIPMQKAEMTSLKNKECSQNVSAVKFSSPIEGDEICKQGARNGKLVADENELDVIEAYDAKNWAYENEVASSSSVTKILQARSLNVTTVFSPTMEYTDPSADSYCLERKRESEPQEKEVIQPSFKKSKGRENVIGFESEMGNDVELSSNNGVEALEMVNSSPLHQNHTEAFGLPPCSLGKDSEKCWEDDSKAQTTEEPDEGISEKLPLLKIAQLQRESPRLDHTFGSLRWKLEKLQGRSNDQAFAGSVIETADGEKMVAYVGPERICVENGCVTGGIDNRGRGRELNPSFVIQEDPDWDANSPDTINPHIAAVLVMNHLNLVHNQAWFIAGNIIASVERSKSFAKSSEEGNIFGDKGIIILEENNINVHDVQNDLAGVLARAMGPRQKFFSYTYMSWKTMMHCQSVMHNNVDSIHTNILPSMKFSLKTFNVEQENAQGCEQIFVFFADNNMGSNQVQLEKMQKLEELKAALIYHFHGALPKEFERLNYEREEIIAELSENRKLHREMGTIAEGTLSAVTLEQEKILKFDNGQFYVWVLEPANLVQKGSTRIEDIFNSDLTWRRLIRTVLEQSLAMLRSHSSVVL